MEYDESTEGSLLINIGLGKSESDGDVEYFGLVVLDISHDDGTTYRFALGDSEDTSDFIECLISAGEKASDLTDRLSEITDPVDAEAAMVAFAMESSAPNN